MIDRAYILGGRVGNAPDLNLVFNGDNYQFNSSNQVSLNFNSPIYGGASAVHALDVTSSVNLSTTNYNISSTDNQGLSSNKYSDFVLLIIYMNPVLPKIATSIHLNNNDFGATSLTYGLQNIPPVDNLTDVGFSIISTYLCDTIQDGEFVYVNGNLLGLIGGDDINAGTCGGPIGCFHYSNNTLDGLCDDFANTFVSGSDAIANIQSLIPFGATSLNIIFEYQSPTWVLGVGSNIIWGMILTYTTPCEVFSATVSNDTVVCMGESIQLQATGGQTYEWLPQTGLSCYTCPNPTFVGDRTTHYTVRIWNTDSCSVVYPVRVTVLPSPQSATLTATPTPLAAIPQAA